MFSDCLGVKIGEKHSVLYFFSSRGDGGKMERKMSALLKFKNKEINAKTE